MSFMPVNDQELMNVEGGGPLKVVATWAVGNLAWEGAKAAVTAMADAERRRQAELAQRHAQIRAANAQYRRGQTRFTQ